jgi:DNA-nicking Smr family endonuclease
MEEYNKQASEFIFRENNATGNVADDTIDLHGQFVEEAEDILEERIRYATSHGQTHLHVYVYPVPYPPHMFWSRFRVSMVVGK